VQLRGKRFDRPDEVRSVDKARIERPQIERFAAREVKTTGDGSLLLFPSPAPAVRGARP
jgi:class 3 adenylate cyclase